MSTVWTVLSHTPIWVYILLGYLVSVGIKASKTRIISLKQIFILPAILTFLSIYTLLTAFSLHFFEVCTWSVAILLGTIIGWLGIYRKYKYIKVDKKKHLIQIPGTWVTLILIAIIFSSKYYFSYELATSPALHDQALFVFSMLAVSGVCTGLFVGKLLAYLYKYNISEHTALDEEH